MPRPKMTSPERAANVRHSAAELPALVGRAVSLSERLGYYAPEAVKAWDAVEVHGATVHRQARLLAGKSRGG